MDQLHGVEIHLLHTMQVSGTRLLQGAEIDQLQSIEMHQLQV